MILICCEQTVAGSIASITTTSITTSEEEACLLPTETTRILYNAIESFKAAGIDLPGWMQYPFVGDDSADDDGDFDDDGSDDNDGDGG